MSAATLSMNYNIPVSYTLKFYILKYHPKMQQSILLHLYMKLTKKKGFFLHFTDTQLHIYGWTNQANRLYIIIKGPFIYYVSTCRGEGGQKMACFAFFKVLKIQLYLHRGGTKSLKCAYVIYEWSPSDYSTNFLPWVLCNGWRGFVS